MTRNFKIAIVVLLIAFVGILGYQWVVYSKILNSIDQEDPSSPIKIGFIAPLTGDAAVYGVPMKNIVSMAVQEINASGGIKGRMMSVIYEDDRCNAKEAANATEKLIAIDKVHLIIGSACSGATQAAVPIAAANQVAILSPAASSPDLTGISPYFFRDYPSDATQGQVLADLAYNKKQWRKVAFMQEQLPYPQGIYTAFTADFQQMGGTVVKEEFPTGQDDFKDQLGKLESQTPDAFFVDTQTPAAAQRIVTQLSDINWHPPLILSDVTAGDADTLTRNATALEGALAAEFNVDTSNPKFMHLSDAYKSDYGVDLPFPSYAQAEYDAVYLLKDGITAVGNDGEKIAAWSRSVKNWDGASGKITIDADGDREGGHVPKMIKDGKDIPYQE